MRCFVHHNQEAIGICQVCGKGLCPDCAVDLGYSICCRGDCEHAAQELHSLRVQNRVALNNWRRNRFLLPLCFIIMGLIFIGMGLHSHNHDQTYGYVVLGAFGIFYGLNRFVTVRRFYKNIDREATASRQSS